VDDLIIVPAKDQFDLQAELHRQIRDSLDEVVNTFDIHYNEILSQLDGSQAKQIGSYQEWWQKLRECLLQHATLHEQFAQNLEIARQNYSESEQQMVHALQSTQSDIAPL
jgi:hypothetical protein